MNKSRRNFLVFIAMTGLTVSSPVVHARRGGGSRLRLGRGLQHG